MGEGRQYVPLHGASMDRMALLETMVALDPPQPPACCDHHAGWADAPPCELDDEPDPDDDPDATAGVDPRSGLPLEHTGVNVRLAP